MAYDYEVLVTALKFFCGESKNICRLCLAPTAVSIGTSVNIGDSSRIQRPYFKDAVTFIDMFEELGVSIKLLH